MFVNTSGLKSNTISSNTFRLYEALNGVVQNKLADFVDAGTVEKGRHFAPDARMKAILTDAVAVAHGFARGRPLGIAGCGTKIHPDRQWVTAFVGGSYQV